MSSNLHTLLSISLVKKASDLHLSAGKPPRLRINGILELIDNYTQPLNAKELEQILFGILNQSQQVILKQNLEIDFVYILDTLGRFRVNVFFQNLGIAAVFRIIPDQIPSLEELKLPQILSDFTNFKNGLVLITGPTGSGKTTTLASMINFINHIKAVHIITIEDPIEFVYKNQLALINQREISNTTLSFKNALRAALRQDPNILLIGELRDLETIRLALTAAETGHLVLSTLHTSSAPKAITRIIDVFPGNEQSLIRTMLADSLRAVVAQILINTPQNCRIAATEILYCTQAISHLIRENKIPQIYSQMQIGKEFGMHTLEQDLQKINKHGLISINEEMSHYNGLF